MRFVANAPEIGIAIHELISESPLFGQSSTQKAPDQRLSPASPLSVSMPHSNFRGGLSRRMCAGPIRGLCSGACRIQSLPLIAA